MLTPPPTILILANLTDSETYERLCALENPIAYRCLTASTADSAIRRCRSHPSVNCILLKLYSSCSQELDGLRQLTEQLGIDCPPIVVIGPEAVEIGVQAFKRGATDYLVAERLTAQTLQVTLQTAIEHTQLQRNSQQNQELFQSSVENLLDCFGIFSAIRNQAGEIVDFRIDYLNAAACENNRMPRELQVGRELCDVLPGHRSTGLFEAYCQVVATGEPLVKEALIYEDRFGDEQYLVRAFDIRASRLQDGFVASWRDVTDRKQLELALRQTVITLQQQQKRLQRLIDTAPIGIGIGTAMGQVNVINDAMLALHGYTREEFEQQGMNWRDFTPPEKGDRIEIAMAQLDEQGVLPPEEKELLWRDGSRHPIWISVTRWMDSLDEHVAFAIDLSPQKQAEAALQASQQRYRDLAEAMPQMVWTADATGAVNYWNQRWYEYSGLTEAESLDRAGLSLVHPHERDRTLEHWTQCVRNGEAFEMEYRLRRWDGVYRWFICRGIPTQTAAGQLMGWVGTITDIDEQKRLEERFRLATRAIDGLVYDWNLETNDVYRSEKLVDLLGIHPDAVPSSVNWWMEQIHPEDWARLSPKVQEQFAGTNELFESEYRIRHADGHWVEVWDRSCLIRDSQGTVRRVVGSTVDISDRKQAKKELEALLIREQTARTEAERANYVKDEFLAVLSHELRSPLNPILGWTKLLQTQRLDAARTADALATIERNAKLQTQLIDDLLDVARILRGKLPLKTEPVDLSLVIESAIDTVQTAATAKNIQLHSMILPIGQVSGDAARLQQVVWNLLSNAIKFTPHQGRVEVQLQSVGDQAQLTVSDTGKGIKPDFLPHIFESFRQEDASTTRRFGGLGLGLAIVRQLVEAHGGTIAVHSDGEGLGARFTVQLPLLPSIDRELPPVEDESELVVDLSPLRILIVDDESDARNLLTVLLTQYGADVLAVPSAMEVLNQLESFQPDVLISDIGMPEMDGYSLIQQIRALPPERGGQIPAIALTAYAKEEDQQRAIASGYQGHVTKPLDSTVLVRTIIALNLPG